MVNSSLPQASAADAGPRLAPGCSALRRATRPPLGARGARSGRSPLMGAAAAETGPPPSSSSRWKWRPRPRHGREAPRSVRPWTRLPALVSSKFESLTATARAARSVRDLHVWAWRWSIAVRAHDLAGFVVRLERYRRPSFVGVAPQTRRPGGSPASYFLLFVDRHDQLRVSADLRGRSW